jgi:phage baseplate assembly protein W
MTPKNTDQNLNFLGRGWGFPPSFDRKRRGVEMTTDVEDIKKSLEILLGTTLGERVMRPEYGSNLESMVFEPLDNSAKGLMISSVREVITLHEPRIIVESVDLEEENLNGLLIISIDFFIPSVNSRANVVYPFYLNEATSLKS